jgi:hypothetical protein
MEFTEQWGYVYMSSGRENQMSGSVQDGLQPVEMVSGNPGQNSVAVIQFADHESAHQCQQGMTWQ